MKISEIYKILDKIAPFYLAEEWDNSGVLLDFGEFNEVVLSLDLDEKLCQNAKEKTLFITHHPLIFKGLKKLDFSTYPSNILQILVKKSCSCIAMHTNYDKCVLNDFVLQEILGIKQYKKNDFICTFEVNQNFDDFCAFIKEKLEIKHLRVSKASDFIQSAAFCTGSGADLIGSFKADCFLSGDFKYHTAFEALQNKLSLIDIEHFASEKYFALSLFPALQSFGISARIAGYFNPFSYK